MTDNLTHSNVHDNRTIKGQVPQNRQAPPPRATSAHRLTRDLLGEVLRAGALGPRSFLGKNGCARSLLPSGCGSQIRPETLLCGRSPIPGTVRRRTESGITKKEQEPENELTAGVPNPWRHRGLELGAFSLFWRSVYYSQTYPVFCINAFHMFL